MTARDIAGALPDIDTLNDPCRSMAMAEAILNADGECIHSYSARWSKTEQAASLRNGSGDEYDMVFAPAGAYIRGRKNHGIRPDRRCAAGRVLTLVCRTLARKRRHIMCDSHMAAMRLH
ncbi:hypothetical protein ACFVU0_24425 [Streptomyces sp. NPDC058122]|uniref:hypothetical protein n=1 Tax=Streptomyces sp. NPDC058122 TaxID=3346349 RepID=UPI0036DFE294